MDGATALVTDSELRTAVRETRSRIASALVAAAGNALKSYPQTCSGLYWTQSGHGLASLRGLGGR
jgi:hypothetical protein